MVKYYPFQKKAIYKYRRKNRERIKLLQKIYYYKKKGNIKKLEQLKQTYEQKYKTPITN